MGDPVRALNEKGIQEFSKFLAELREGSTRQTPKELLTDPSYSSKIADKAEVEDRLFNNKLEMAKYLYEALQIFPQSRT